MVKKALNPKFDFTKLKEAKTGAAAQPKEEKKKPQPKKAAEDETPKEPARKEPTWEDELPQTTFDLFNYKTLIVNAADKKEALKTLWDSWENNAFSFWFVHYQKYEGEGVKLPPTNNLMNGFM